MAYCRRPVINWLIKQSARLGMSISQQTTGLLAGRAEDDDTWRFIKAPMLAGRKWLLQYKWMSNMQQTKHSLYTVGKARNFNITIFPFHVISSFSVHMHHSTPTCIWTSLSINVLAWWFHTATDGMVKVISIMLTATDPNWGLRLLKKSTYIVYGQLLYV